MFVHAFFTSQPFPSTSNMKPRSISQQKLIHILPKIILQHRIPQRPKINQLPPLITPFRPVRQRERRPNIRIHIHNEVRVIPPYRRARNPRQSTINRQEIASMECPQNRRAIPYVARYDQAGTSGCARIASWRKTRRVKVKTRSPNSAAIRLNCG